MNTPLDHVQIVWAEAQQLTRYLHTLPPAAWHHPSACERWQVGDVVVHLAACAEVYADSICRGLEGNSTPPPGISPVGTDLATAAERSAQRVSARRQHLGDQVLATFTSATERCGPLSTCGCVRWPCMAGTSARGLSRQPICLPRAWRFFMEPRTLHGVLLPDARLSGPVRARFALTGVAASSMDLVVENATAQLEAASETPAQLHFYCDTETFVLILYGRLRLETAMAEGRVVSESDPELVAILDQCFKGV